jgi:8-oxo-dGTP diphosphatase
MPDEQQSGRQQGDHHKGVVAGVAVLIWRGDEALLVKRAHSHGSGTWAPPGGHLEFDETFSDCAVREVREEVGVEIGEPHFLCITRDVFEEAGRSYVTIWMQADYVSGEAKPRAKRELSKIGWYKWSELPQPRFLALRHLLEGDCYPKGANESLGQKRG